MSDAASGTLRSKLLILIQSFPDETTGNTIAFLLYELARHPDVQDRLRSEIQETLTKARARGDDDLTVADMDNMKYALSVVKVCGHPSILPSA